MTNARHRLLAACAALVLAAPVAAARPCHHRHHAAALPETATVTVHHGVAGAAAPQFAEGGAPWIGGDEAFGAGPGYWEANYGREDDAAIFAERYGCARPIWNPKTSQYISACN